MKDQNNKYENLIKLISNNKSNNNFTPTPLQEHLLNEDCVLSDYRSVNKSLDLVALEVRRYTKQEVTYNFLKDNFRKRNGNEFSQRACENARDYANKIPL